MCLFVHLLVFLLAPSCGLETGTLYSDDGVSTLYTKATPPMPGHGSSGSVRHSELNNKNTATIFPQMNEGSSESNNIKQTNIRSDSTSSQVNEILHNGDTVLTEDNISDNSTASWMTLTHNTSSDSSDPATFVTNVSISLASGDAVVLRHVLQLRRLPGASKPTAVMHGDSELAHIDPSPVRTRTRFCLYHVQCLMLLDARWMRLGSAACCGG
jgi:hypothetical protein